ncbi:hypothetical protein ACJZRZ_004209 [Vibrio parahaemolyticus]
MLSTKLRLAFKRIGLLHHALYTNGDMTYEQMKICQDAYFHALQWLNATLLKQEHQDLKVILVERGLLGWKAYFRLNELNRLLVSPFPLRAEMKNVIDKDQES